MKTTTYPEINGLSLPQLKDAIALGEANLNALAGDPRLDLVKRLNAMYDRRRRLYHTERSIAAGNAALRRGK